MKTKIILNKHYKFRKKWRVRKAQRVALLMNRVINSELFEKGVLKYEFTDRRYKPKKKAEVSQVQDNKEILDILRKGNEQISNEGADYLWKLNVKLGRGLKQKGRREGNLVITQNWFFKKSGNEKSIAAHWFHEYSHVLGFKHDYEKTERRPDSIPYALGSIVEEVLNDPKFN